MIVAVTLLGYFADSGTLWLLGFELRVATEECTAGRKIVMMIDTSGLCLDGYNSSLKEHIG